MTTLYTYETLKQMKGQAVKDIWHSYLGKPAGLKNTTGLHNTEEIIQAILKGQVDPEFLNKFGTKTPKQKEESPIEPSEVMPPKKPGPKSKVKIETPTPVKKSSIQAVESPDIPLIADETITIRVRKLHVGEQSYFYNSITLAVYAIEGNRPGDSLGFWNPDLRTIVPQA